MEELIGDQSEQPWMRRDIAEPKLRNGGQSPLRGAAELVEDPLLIVDVLCAERLGCIRGAARRYAGDVAFHRQPRVALCLLVRPRDRLVRSRPRLDGGELPNEGEHAHGHDDDADNRPSATGVLLVSNGNDDEHRQSRVSNNRGLYPRSASLLGDSSWEAPPAFDLRRRIAPSPRSRKSRAIFGAMTNAAPT